MTPPPIPPAYPTDESLIGAWIGLGYLAFVLLAWIPFDRWLHRHHHEYITDEVRELLKSGSWSALLFCGFLGAVLFIGGYHFFYVRSN